MKNKVLMNKQVSIKSLIYIVLFILFSTSVVYAGQIEDMYRDLTVLDKTGQIGRKSYTTMGDKFYRMYSSNPSGRYADEALLGAARTYRRSYERFRVQQDMDKALNYYRMVQSAFSSPAARRAYIESADLFIARRDTASAKFTLNKTGYGLNHPIFPKVIFQSFMVLVETQLSHTKDLNITTETTV